MTVFGADLIARAAFNLFQIAFGLSLFVVAIYLWRLRPLARSVTKFIIGLLIVVGLGGTFNPFYALDYGDENNGREPPWLLMLCIAAPLVAAGMFAFWTLDKYKGEFGIAPRRSSE